MSFVKVVVFKCGNIGTSPLLELLLDELADRKDIKIRAVTTGSKLGVEDVEDALPKILEFSPDVVVVVSPNAVLPGPAKARETFVGYGKPCIIITDAPGKGAIADIEKQGFGYIIVTGDPLIGARKEFLDPTEMALFNSNIIKVLAATGVFRIVQEEIDRVIYAVEAGKAPVLPKLVLNVGVLRDRSVFGNPYAKAKAMAAYLLLEKVAEVNTLACFVEKESEKYLALVASSHEIAQAAARLAEDAREIEKCNDSVRRKPHAKDGRGKNKAKLFSESMFDDE